MSSKTWLQRHGLLFRGHCRENGGRLLLLAAGWLLTFTLPAAAAVLPDSPGPASANRESRPYVPEALAEDLQRGQPREVLLLFDDSAVRQETRAQGKSAGERLALRASRYRHLKAEALSRLPARDGALLRDYSHLPVSFLRLHGATGLVWLRSRPEILAVYENGPIYFDLSQSLPFIGQPEVAAAGFRGQGATAAVIDTGINYTRAEFGSCTAPGIPDSCRVAASVEIAPDDGKLDDNGHGTNVSGIVAGVAPAGALAVLDVFDGASSSDALVIAGINWVLANYDVFQIKAVNMSLGNGLRYTSPCDKWYSNPYLLPVNDLRDVGIVVAAAAGNEGYIDGIGRPACTAGVLSVGAVYDADVGARAWSVCSDPATAADKVACFSNSAGFLSTLAPGVLITAGGYIASGTSQAAPHVTGAALVLAAAEPSFTPDDIGERLTATGAAVIDQRNSLLLPRLDLDAALAPEIEAAAASGEEEIPFLPGWALFGLGAWIGLSGIRKHRRRGR